MHRQNKAPNYSFKKSQTQPPFIEPNEKKEESADRKPVSPISGLNDKMKTIEDKIQKYKVENARFENKLPPINNLIDSKAEHQIFAKSPANSYQADRFCKVK